MPNVLLTEISWKSEEAPLEYRKVKMEADWAQKELSFYFETLVRHSKTRGSGEPFESPLQKEDIGSFEDAIP